MEHNEVVVTGLGVVTSVGIGVEKFWKSICDGKTGISEVDAFDTSDYTRHYAGQIKEDIEPYLDQNKVKTFGRASKLAIIAIQEALANANLSIEYLQGKRVGLFVGTTMGEPNIIEKYDFSIKQNQKWHPSSESVSNVSPENLTRNILNYFKLKNIKSKSFTSACAASNYGTIYGYNQIRKNSLDICICGGTDTFSKIAFTGFHRMMAMAEKQCTPFEDGNYGMMLGEGSGFIILENKKNIQKRNITIQAVIEAYGHSCDASHMTAPQVAGVSKAIQKMLKRTKQKEANYFFCAHGTGTKENDRVEKQVIEKNLQNHKQVKLKSLKAHLGHPMGAAAGIENVYCVLQAKNHPNFKIINNSQAFGGNNAALLLDDGLFKQ